MSNENEISVTDEPTQPTGWQDSLEPGYLSDNKAFLLELLKDNMRDLIQGRLGVYGDGFMEVAADDELLDKLADDLLEDASMSEGVEFTRYICQCIHTIFATNDVKTFYVGSMFPEYDWQAVSEEMLLDDLADYVKASGDESTFFIVEHGEEGDVVLETDTWTLMTRLSSGEFYPLTIYGCSLVATINDGDYYNIVDAQTDPKAAEVFSILREHYPTTSFADIVYDPIDRDMLDFEAEDLECR